MRFNVSRQPIVPAFLTLVLLAILAMCNTTTGVVTPHTPWSEGVEVGSMWYWLLGFQAAHPAWSHLIGGFLMIFSGMTLGRLSIVYRIYGTRTCIPIPLYGIAVLGVATSGFYLPALVASTLLTLSLKNFCYSQRNGYSFDRLFRGGMFLSLLILVAPVTFPLMVMFILSMALFRNTTREMLVALTGFLLPVFALCYLNWALGGIFYAPLVETYHDAIHETFWLLMPLKFLDEGYRVLGVTLIVLVALDLIALLFFRRNSYALPAPARRVLYMASHLFCLTVVLYLFPVSDPAWLQALVAVPSALLLGALFIRLRHQVAQLLYPILLIAAIVALYL